MMKIRTALSILLSGWALGTTPAFAENPALERAWAEYNFQSYDLAESYFQKVLDGEPTPEEALEAKLGMGMTLQFTESGADLDGAKALYEEILDAGLGPERRALVQTFIADIHIERGETEKALAVLDELIRDHAQSVLGQDALIRKLLLTMGPYGSEQSLAAAREAEEVLAGIEASKERPLLVPMIADLLGHIYYWAGQYEKAAGHYETYTVIGTPDTNSYGNHASQLYRLATMYENELNNPEKAGQFYRRLLMETPNSSMSYFSLEKAVELNAIRREEVEALRLGGMPDEVLDELFSGKNEQETR